MSQWIALFPAAIGNITLDGIHPAILNSFHNTNMVSSTVQTAAFFVLPVEEDDHTRSGRDISSFPLVVLSEPLNTLFTAGEFGNNTGFDIAATINTLAHKASTPVHTFSKAVPTPLVFATYIADLGSRHFNNQTGSIQVIEKLIRRIIAKYMRNIVYIAITVPINKNAPPSFY